MPDLAGRRTLAPPAPSGAKATLVHLLPDGRRLAYVRTDDTGSGVFLADPDTGWTRRLAGYPHPLRDLAVSADGVRVAWVIADPAASPADQVVAWARTDAPGEEGRRPGTAFAWSSQRPTLFVADPVERALVRHDAVTGKSRRLADLPDEGIPAFPPRVAVTADAARIAFTSRRAARDLTEVWVLDDEGVKLLTQVPGAEIHVDPFWSPGGGSIGLHIAHPAQEQSAVILVPKLQGEGEIYYEAELVDPPGAPAWSPSSAFIAFFAVERDAAPRLSLIDCRTRAVTPLLDPGEAPGVPRFLDPHHLAVEGGEAAVVLAFNDPM